MRKHSAPGEYGITYKPVKGYKPRNGAYGPPPWKNSRSYWRKQPAS